MLRTEEYVLASTTSLWNTVEISVSEQITPQVIECAQRLGDIAAERGQSLAQMAISWLLAKDVTSVIIGASSVAQLEDNLQAINNTTFTSDELARIASVLPK